MPEHVDIVDPDIHEPKGAAGAPADHIIVADGAGGTNWRDPVGFFDPAAFAIEDLIAGKSVAADQYPSANDTVVQVEFGAAQLTSGDPVQLLVDGTVKINTSGTYRVEAYFNIGKVSGGTAVSRFFLRAVKNGTSVNGTTSEYINPDASTTHKIVSWLDLTAGDLITHEYYRSGGTDGGLVMVSPAVSGWSAVPSASVLVQRFIPA